MCVCARACVDTLGRRGDRLYSIPPDEYLWLYISISSTFLPVMRIHPVGHYIIAAAEKTPLNKINIVTKPADLYGCAFLFLRLTFMGGSWVLREQDKGEDKCNSRDRLVFPKTFLLNIRPADHSMIVLAPFYWTITLYAALIWNVVCTIRLGNRRISQI
jgi:hypothetical protein